MQQVIVTGVNGFVGHHLTDALIKAGYEVVGVGREAAVDSNLAQKLHSYIQCELTDAAAVKELPLEQVSGVINLAGLAAVGPSFDNPQLYMDVNTGVLRTLAEAAIYKNVNPRIIAVSSGAIYKSGQVMPLTEDSEVDPDSSPYAKSKLAMEDLSKEYRRQDLDVIVVRPFNHIGPGQLDGFLLPDLYRKVTSAYNRGSSLLVGNLTTKRDYTDVRDVATAYVKLLTTESLSADIFNVSSGRSVSGEEILTALLQTLGYDNLVPEVDEGLFRPSDAPNLFGDSSRLTKQTGWQPTIQLQQTISDYVQSKL